MEAWDWLSLASLARRRSDRRLGIGWSLGGQAPSFQKHEPCTAFPILRLVPISTSTACASPPLTSYTACLHPPNRSIEDKGQREPKSRSSRGIVGSPRFQRARPANPCLSRAAALRANGLAHLLAHLRRRGVPSATAEETRAKKRPPRALTPSDDYALGHAIEREEEHEGPRERSVKVRAAASSRAHTRPACSRTRRSYRGSRQQTMGVVQ